MSRSANRLTLVLFGQPEEWNPKLQKHPCLELVRLPCGPGVRGQRSVLQYLAVLLLKSTFPPVPLLLQQGEFTANAFNLHDKSLILMFPHRNL